MHDASYNLVGSNYNYEVNHKFESNSLDFTMVLGFS